MWQINDAGLPDLMSGYPARAGRVTAAMMKMQKADIRALEDAAAA